MKELVEMMAIAIKYKNYSNYLSLSNEFHDIYRNKSENKVLLNTLNNLVYNFIPKSYSSENDEELFKMLSYSNKEHLRILEALKSKDSKEVELLLREHWKTIPSAQMK